MGARAGEASGFIHFGPGSAGRGAAPPAASGCFVFLGQHSAIDPVSKAALTHAIGASEGALLVWAPRAADLAADGVTRLSFDAEGRLSSPGTVEAGGVRVQLADDVQMRLEPGALVLEGGVGAADGTSTFTTRGRVRVPLEGPETGALEIELDAAPVEASFRYFWGPLGGLSRAAYPVFDAPPRQPLLLRAHPHRGRAELRVRADAGAARYATTFRTPFGHTVQLGLTATSGFAYQYDPVVGAAYPVLDGAWTVHRAGATAGLPLDVMLGTSGIEYARLADGAPVEFAPGGPAYAPYFDTAASGATALTAAAPGVSEPVTTSWLAVPGPREAGPVGLAGALPGYFSQPERSPFYEIAGLPASFLRFLPVDAGRFPRAAFPAVPYAGIAADAPVGEYARLEVEVLGTVRRNVLLLGPGREAAVALARTRAAAAPSVAVATGACHGPTGPLGPTDAVHAAVTPRGLLAGFDLKSGDWRELRLLQADHGSQSLRLTEIESPLRGALLSNQLFLVATDREKLLRACSVEYQLTEQSYALLSAMGPEQAALARCTRYLQGFVYESLPYFDAVLRVAIGDEAMKTYGPVFRRVAARAQFVVRDWTFDLSPYLWGDNQTVLIFKYAELPLDRLVADTSLWTAQDAFLAEPIEATRKKLTATSARRSRATAAWVAGPRCGTASSASTARCRSPGCRRSSRGWPPASTPRASARTTSASTPPPSARRAASSGSRTARCSG
jgi:hypothetical protein